jgi:subtilisin-like proprotein convertase family protein
LTVPRAGRITRLTVAVDIGHPYIGDLQVTLTAPSGSRIVLHNRTGASSDDLVRTYSSAETPDLAALVGQAAQGDWLLKVADLAGWDVGTLRRWRLDIDLEAGAQVVRGDAAPALTIPDNNPAGVSSFIAFTETGVAQDLKVSVDITHTFIGDLRVELIAPSGQVAVLHDRAGGSLDNLITTYEAAATPALAALAGQPLQGVWALRVTDLAGQDVGKLNRWDLEVSYQG